MLAYKNVRYAVYLMDAVKVDVPPALHEQYRLTTDALADFEAELDGWILRQPVEGDPPEL